LGLGIDEALIPELCASDVFRIAHAGLAFLFAWRACSYSSCSGAESGSRWWNVFM
jgi:hypothetical protein